MSVKKEENGTWTAQCWHTDWSGKKSHKKKRGFATKKEALEWERSLSMTQSTMDKPLGEFMEIYFEDKKNELKDRTKTSKRYMMDTHIVPYFGNKKMSEITSSDIIKWQNIIIDKGYSQTYLRMIQNQMTALFTHACKIYDLPNNPCKKVKKMGRSDARRLDFWTETEYQKFINQMEPGSRYYVLFETLFWTGMREGELLALQKKDVDTVNGTISVNKTYYRKNGMDMVTTPKTEQSVREIVIPKFLVKELQDYMDRMYGLEDEDRIFPLVAEAIQHKLKAEIEKGGLKKIRVHDLRHSHVAYLIHQGVEPLVIKERLGHKDIQITLNTYGHLYPSKQNAVAELLEQKRSEVKCPKIK